MGAKDADYGGGCLCGRVEVRVAGAPAVAGFCHCASCRTWHAAPVNAWASWPAAAVEIVRGADALESFAHGHSLRHWCRHCGTGVMNRLGDWTVVYAMVLANSGYVHQASCHIHCDESVFDLQDGLPKYVDYPAEWGGSGKTVPEPARTGMRPVAS